MKPNNYQKTVLALASKHLGVIQAYLYLPPDDNFVWSIKANDQHYIIKIKPILPYRLRREILAYQHLSGNGLPIPELVHAGEIDSIPFLILTQKGSKTIQDEITDIDAPIGPQLITDVLTGLHRFSELYSDSFEYIKSGVSVRDRDHERLAYTSNLNGLNDEHHGLLRRIETANAGPYRQLAHRDFSPRQVVLNGDEIFLIDFESIGPGILERDIGEFVGGILKFGVYHESYGKAVIDFAEANALDSDFISDFAIYSLLWSIRKDTSRQIAKKRFDLATACLNDSKWITKAVQI